VLRVPLTTRDNLGASCTILIYQKSPVNKVSENRQTNRQKGKNKKRDKKKKQNKTKQNKNKKPQRV